MVSQAWHAVTNRRLCARTFGLDIGIVGALSAWRCCECEVNSSDRKQKYCKHTSMLVGGDQSEIISGGLVSVYLVYAKVAVVIHAVFASSCGIRQSKLATQHVDGTGNKLSNYSTFKHSFDLEKYVLQMSLDDRRNFTKLRISCHDLAIETGRYSNNRKPLSERICNLCNLNQIEDEFHFFMTCPFYNNEREIYKACLQSLSSISLSPTRETYTTLMQCANGDLEFSRATCQFVNACFAKRKLSL